MKKILSIFAVLFCLTACGKSYPKMDYQEILDKEAACDLKKGTAMKWKYVKG